jgi:hypothetical protein
VSIELVNLNLQLDYNLPPSERQFSWWAAANAVGCVAGSAWENRGFIPSALGPLVEAGFCVSAALEFFKALNDWSKDPTDTNHERTAASLFEAEFGCIMAIVAIQMAE